MKFTKTLMIISTSISLVVMMFFNSIPGIYAQTDQEWSAPVNLSNAGASTNPSIVIDKDDVIHVIWIDEFDGYKYSKSTDGQSWTSPVNVRFPFTLASNSKPTFVVTPDGVINIFWRDESNRLFYSQTRPVNFGNPTTWSQNQELADSALDFEVMADDQGVLHLSYIRGLNQNTDPAGVYYRRRTTSGWSPSTNLYVSLYFRSLEPEDTHVSLATGTTDNGKSVYVAWDDRTQRGIYLARSLDGGLNWEEPYQVKSPDDSIGVEYPFNINLMLNENKALLIWQIGIPGGGCTQYSQSSTDGGNNFGEPVRMLKEFTECSQQTKAISQQGDFSLFSLTFQNDLSLIAWDGANWSEVKNQSDLSVFENPATSDSVLFGCKNVVVSKGVIHAVGCDTGSGKDIWYRSRDLGTLVEWFPPPSAWKTPDQITSDTQQITMLSSLKDENNIVHVFWIKSSNQDNTKDRTLEYANWRNGVWSRPEEILAGLNGNPLQYTANANIPGRLSLSWVDAETGEILFSWANSGRADNPSEWDIPVIVPSNSQVNSSPDILADASGRIIIAYAVPVNEQRGIYFVSSDDAGQTWSGPFPLFDAHTIGWDMVNNPKLGLSGDGSIHVLFERFSLQGDQRQSMGLYYTRSSNGGSTWSDAESVSEGVISWSEIVTFDKNIIHRLWQEKNGTNLVNYHQISEDGGLNWNTPIAIPSVNIDGSPSVDIDQTGNLHLLQPAQNTNGLIGSHEEWNGRQWNVQAPYELSVEGLNPSYLLASSVTLNGYLLTINLISYDVINNGRINEILGMERALDVPNLSGAPILALIATPLPQPGSTDNQDFVGTPTLESNISSLDDPTASLSRGRNLTGILFILGVLILTFIILRPKSGNKRQG